MRFRFHNWALVTVLCGAFASPMATFAAPASADIAVMEARSIPPFELLSPRAGDALQAGASMAIEWRALPPLAEAFESGRINEWEAFLSIDGGLSYLLRLTPHMEGDVSRLVFEVPDLPTRDARLLFRFGDGHHDFAWRLPLRFSITASPLPVKPTARQQRLEREEREEHLKPSHGGEPALEGEPGVTAWVEGSALGEDLQWVYAEDAETDELLPRKEQPRLTAFEAGSLAVLTRAFSGLPEPRVWERPQQPPEKFAAAVQPPEILPPIDILSRTQRLNE